MSGPVKRREDAMPLERGIGVAWNRRRVRRRAQELLREAKRILRRCSSQVPPEGAQATQAAYDELTGLSSAAGQVDVARLQNAAGRLDQALEKHFGRFRKSTGREYLESILWAVGLAAVIRFFLIEPFSIPSGSMIPTLEVGDKLFVNKAKLGLYVPLSPSRLIHWSEPKRGDIIVFEFRKAGDPHDGEDYIKRVVALPGDRVRLEGHVLVLNGKRIEAADMGQTRCDQHDNEGNVIASFPCVLQRERVPRTGAVGDPDAEITEYYTQHHLPGVGDPKPDWPRAIAPDADYFGDKASNPNWPDVLIPEGHVLAMGDNRDQSQDGRYWGLVPFDRIKGTAFLNWYPPSRIGLLH